jgi:hypothetical protein
MAKHQKRPGSGESEPNLIPIMNVMFLLIPALLLAMEIARFASIHVSPPKSCVASTSADVVSDPLDLKVVIREDGHHLSAVGQQLGPSGGQALESDAPTVPLARPRATSTDFDRYDYIGLEVQAEALKRAFPLESAVTVSAEGDIPFQVLTRTLDALRGRECRLLRTLVANEEIPENCLFYHPVVEA